jgi:hypothetical protein
LSVLFQASLDGNCALSAIYIRGVIAMTQPIEHQMKCGETYVLKIRNSKGELEEHHITSTSGGLPGQWKPRSSTVAYATAAYSIDVELPNETGPTLAIPFPELPPPGSDEPNRLVAYRVDATPSVANGLHIDMPGSALSDVEQGAVFVIGVPRSDATGPQ